MSLFDGMAGVLNSIFGTHITFVPSVGEAVQVMSIFRREPIEVLGNDGRPVMTTGATWKVPRNVITAGRGDRVLAPDGVEYRIVNHIPSSGSSADDAFVVYELEQVE